MRSPQGIHTTKAAESSFAENDVKLSIASNFKECVKAAIIVSKMASEKKVITDSKVSKSLYDKDAERYSKPGDLSRTNTLREIGMSECTDPLLKSIQAQAYLSWCSTSYLSNSGSDEKLCPLESMCKGFNDISYVLEKEDQGYILKLQTRSLMPYVMLQKGEALTTEAYSADMTKVSGEELIKKDTTRDIKEAISFCSEAEIYFKKCNRDEFFKFIEDNYSGNKESCYNQDDKKTITELFSDTVEYYIPVIRKAHYEVYISPKFSRYTIRNQFGQGPKKAGITVVKNPLDIRLGFIKGALTDAVGAIEDLKKKIADGTVVDKEPKFDPLAEKNKHIQYALINLTELGDNVFVSREDLIKHELLLSTMNYISDVSNGGADLDSESQNLLWSFSVSKRLELGYRDKVSSSKASKKLFSTIMDMRLRGAYTLLNASIGSVENKDKNQSIEHCLQNLESLIKSSSISTKYLIANDDFKSIIKSITTFSTGGETLSPSNEEKLASFFRWNDSFREAIKESKEAQGLFINFVKKSKSHLVANGLCGISAELLEEVGEIDVKGYNEDKKFKDVFWRGQGDKPDRLKEYNAKANEFEQKAHSIMRIGVVVSACILGVGFGMGMPIPLIIGLAASVFILCAMRANHFNSESKASRGIMVTLRNKAFESNASSSDFVRLAQVKVVPNNASNTSSDRRMLTSFEPGSGGGVA